MIKDIKVNLATGDIEFEDIENIEAFKQALLLQLLHQKGSVLQLQEVGSNIYQPLKDTEDLPQRLNDIVTSAWDMYTKSGEVLSFEILSVNMDYSTKELFFSIEVISDKGQFVITNN
jgi:flagellar biosynthesis/type III secretory pathway chaperone